MKRAISLLVLSLLCTGHRPAMACDCSDPAPEEVFAKAELLFVGRAMSLDTNMKTQNWQVLATLKGATDSSGKHTIRYEELTMGCTYYASPGMVSLVSLTERRKEPSICMGSGGLHGFHHEMGRYFELAGAKTTNLTATSLKALLEPRLKKGRGDVWLVGAGTSGKTLIIAGRKVHLVDAIDGVPRGTIFEIGRMLALKEIVYVEISGKPVRTAEAILKLKKGGKTELVWAFWKGGAIRIPEPQ